MPLSQNDDSISLVDLNNPTQQIAFASGSATSTGSLGFIALGVTSAGTSSFLQLDESGVMRVTGSVTQGSPNSNANGWPVKLVSGSTQIGTAISPLFVEPSRYYKTAFGEFRTASPYTLADLVNKYGLDTFEYAAQTSGSGGISANLNQSALVLSASTASGDRALLRTNTFYRYQAGKTQAVKQTVYHADTGRANQVRRWGIFDDQDGLFYAVSGTNFGVYQRSSTTGVVTETFITQSSFNVDPLNGSGPSGVTLDLTKGNIYETHFQWLGVGNVDFFVNGIHAHRISNPNTIAGPYMKTGQLPMSWEIANTGASTASSFTYICSSILSLGGETPPAFSFCAFNSAAISVTTTERPVLTVRPKLAYGGTANRMLILPVKLSISTEGSRIAYRIVLNATTITGASYTSVNANSGVEFDVAGTAITGGETIYYGFLPNTNDGKEVGLAEFFESLGRKLRVNAFGVSSDTITVMAVNEASGTTLVKAALTWREIR